jgi:RHS repeat-associated protein
MLSMQLGDAAETRCDYQYDTLRRLKTVQTYRAGPELWTTPSYPVSSDQTQQLLLEDSEFSYDLGNNVREIRDYRIPEEWPDSAKPVTRSFEYDDLYRLTRSVYEYPSGADAWKSPHEAENEGRSDGPKPSPHVSFEQRIREQRYQYDHLGNLTKTSDDAEGFYDRSLGLQQHGAAGAGPHQLVTASNRASAAGSERKGDLETRFDAGGNLTDLVVRRDGPCLPAGASCWQRFHYGFDELSRLDLAQRWDLSGSERTSHDDLDEPLPARAADVELRHTYDSADSRVIKTAVDPSGNQSHAVYVNGSYELRRTWWSDGDYVQTPQTVTVYVAGGGVRGRVVYSEQDLPSLSSGKQHLFLQKSDYLGSTTAVIDHETGELVEYSTYQPYGGAESDYRPARWGEFREDYKFSGKEEDVEVGLAYFGARFMVVGLGRWASPDPVTIHELWGDANPYAYVGGRPMVAVDPDGRLPVIVAAIIVGALVSSAISGATYAIAAPQFSWGGFFAAAGMGAVVGAASAAGGIGVAAGIGGAGVWAALGGAAAGGAIGGGLGYVGNAPIYGYDLTLTGLGVAMGIGAVSGLAFYGADRLAGGYLSKPFEWLTNEVAGIGAGTGAGAGAGSGPSGKGPIAPKSTTQTPYKTWDRTDGILPEDPNDIFRSAEEVLGPPKPTPKPSVQPSIKGNEPRSRAQILDELFGRNIDVPEGLSPQEAAAFRAETRLQQIKTGSYRPPDDLSEAHLDWYADIAENAIFNPAKQPSSAGRGSVDMVARVQGTRLDIIWEVRSFFRP